MLLVYPVLLEEPSIYQLKFYCLIATSLPSSDKMNVFSVTFYFTYSLFVAQILGPDSGWQPIPLTEVITAAAAKKAYRRATLCVHPDKLQQRGASIQQKYVCEKVFDLLKVCDFLDTGPCLLIFLFSHST